MKKIFLIIVCFICVFIFNYKEVHAYPPTWDYFPIGANYLDPVNHRSKSLGDNNFEFFTLNPFVVKETKDYSLFVTKTDREYINSYEFTFYDDNGNVLDTPVYFEEMKNQADQIVSIYFTVPVGAKRISIKVYFYNSTGSSHKDVIDGYYVFCEGSENPSNGAHIYYQGPRTDLEPVIETDYGLYITDIDNPITVEEIKAGLRAYDDTDGDVTDSITIYQDNYSQNKDILGTYDIVFRACDSKGNHTDFTVYVQIIDTTAPSIGGNLNLTANNSKVLDQSSIISGLVLADNYDSSSNINLELISDNYTENYNIVGTYELVFKATDSSGNSSQATVYVNVIDVIKPVINGPMVHLKNNNLTVDLLEFINMYTAIDETDGDITNKIKVIEDRYTINQYNAGIWEVVLQVSDAANNTTEITIEIEVVDKIGPVFFIDKTKIVIDLNTNNLDVNALINYFQNTNIIQEDVPIEVIEDTYTKNKNTPGVYKLVLGYGEETLDIEVEILETIEEIEEVEKPSFFKRALSFFQKIILAIINFFRRLFY